MSSRGRRRRGRTRSRKKKKKKKKRGERQALGAGPRAQVVAWLVCCAGLAWGSVDYLMISEPGRFPTGGRIEWLCLWSVGREGVQSMYLERTPEDEVSRSKWAAFFLTSSGTGAGGREAWATCTCRRPRYPGT